MKKSLILISVLAALLSKQLIADDQISGGARANLLTGELIVPCIKVDDPGNEYHERYFDVKFKQSGNSFEFISAEEEDAEVCIASIATSLIADQDTLDINGTLGSNPDSNEEDLNAFLELAKADMEAKFYDELAKNGSIDLTPEEFVTLVLRMIVPILNDYFVSSRLFTEHKFNIFGKEDNHLDPMDFNGKVSAREERCVARYPFWPWKGKCVGHAGVQAGVHFLRGLASARISDITVTNFTPESYGGTGTIALTSGAISGNASASAWAGVLEPSASGSLNIYGLDPSGAQNVQLTVIYDQELEALVPQLKTLMLTSMRTPFHSINLHLNGFLGSIFGPILSAVANSIYQIVGLFFDVDGVIGNALIGVTNKGIAEGKNEINKVLREIWIKEIMSSGFEVNLIQSDGSRVPLSLGRSEAERANQ